MRLVPTALALTALALAAGVTLSALRLRPEAPPRARFLAPPPELSLRPQALEKGSAPQESDRRLEPHEFYFTRAIYSEGGRWGRGYSWATDYPKADLQFITVVKRLAGLDMYDGENAVELSDPVIRRYPFLYALEVGRGMSLTDAELRGLRDYLAAGGFLVIDDFWGSYQWANFESEIQRVLPGRPIVDVPMDHTIFRIFYNIEEILQVPSINNWVYNGRTHQEDGFVPYVKGIFDDQGRLMVVINWNTDLGDAWEWAENPYYPLERSTFAFEMGVNMIMYGMTH